MKKTAVFLALLLLTMVFSSCSEKKEETIASHVTVNGVELALGAEFTEEKETSLGEPVDMVQAPSCHYDGSDSIYTYDGFTVYTYMQGEKSILYSVEITDAAIATPEGAKVGMTQAEIHGLYGDSYEKTAVGMAYSIGEGMTLTFRITDDKVTLIEYYKE